MSLNLLISRKREKDENTRNTRGGKAEVLDTDKTSNGSSVSLHLKRPFNANTNIVTRREGRVVQGRKGIENEEHERRGGTTKI